MIGKKLDARSYTILLLAAMVVLLALNLFAQRGTLDVGTLPAGDRTDLSDSAAIQQVAAATREVADSNREIARAIDNLARAVGGLEMSVTVNNSDDKDSSSNASRVTPQVGADGRTTMVPVTDSGADIPPDTEFEYEGTLNIR
ncbi:hypothetical protein KQI84_11840 [bacterium]|nr:hypothetical protein [bacterium]